VIAKAYHRWGVDCVQRLRGMFAFAVAEVHSGRLVLVRDRLGIKPLYLGYGQHKPKRCNRAVDRPGSPLFVDEE